MKPRVIHPYLAAVYPVLFLLSHNIGEIGGISSGEVILPALAVFVFALVMVLVCSKVLGDRQRGGLLVSLFLVWFFSYGHLFSIVINLVENSFGYLRFLVRPRYVLPIYLLPLLGVGFVIVTTKRGLHTVTRFANAALVILVALSLVPLLGFWFHVNPGRQASGGLTVEVPLDKTQRLPDIYYIILDAYGSAETFRNIYGYDNTEFMEFLTEKGFHVWPNSRSNYAYTTVSLASSLNMQYLHDVLDENASPRSFEFDKPNRMVHNSRVVRELKSNGYKYIHFPSGAFLTNYNEHADVLVSSGSWNEFQMMLIKYTVVGPLFPVNQRGKVNFTFSRLAEARGMIDGPLFVFAHIMCPHPPYVFGPDGEEVDSDRGDDLRDWDSKDAYIDQVRYVNKRIRMLVSEILDEYENPPVIVLQGDHGPSSTSYDHPDSLHYQEVMTILNAYYLPGVDEELVYPSITPVNTFRLILRNYLGVDIPLLEDHSYHSHYSVRPFDFVDVTGMLAPVN